MNGRYIGFGHWQSFRQKRCIVPGPLHSIHQVLCIRVAMYAQKTISVWMHTHKSGFLWWGRFPPPVGAGSSIHAGQKQIPAGKCVAHFPFLALPFSLWHRLSAGDLRWLSVRSTQVQNRRISPVRSLVFPGASCMAAKTMQLQREHRISRIRSFRSV